MSALTDVEFFFDPSCPWTWVTSRWLATVAPARDLAVTWRTWSLAIKNEGRELPATMPAVWRERILAGQAFATQALRVAEAVNAKEGNAAVGRLYTELGRLYHGEGADEHRAPGSRGDVVAHALAAAGLPAPLADAARDEAWDEAVRDNMDDIRRQVGDEVGVPIISLRQGEQVMATAGPIMSEVPPLPRSLALWDAVVTVVREPGVFELKRHRTAGPNLPTLDADGRTTR